MRDHSAFDELGFRPVTAGQPAERQMDDDLGQPSSMPVMISPTGAQAIHPDGEVGVARPLPSRASMGLSSFVDADRGRHRGQRPDLLPDLLGRRQGLDGRSYGAGEAAGAVGMILTDWSSARPDWDGQIRSRSRSRSFRRSAVIRKPRFMWSGSSPGASETRRAELRDRRFEATGLLRGLWRLDDEHLRRPGGRGLAALAVGRRVHGQGRRQAGEARRAVDVGVTAISVSTMAETMSTLRLPRSGCCPGCRRSATTSRS